MGALPKKRLLGSEILDSGMTPAQWVKALADLEIIITERTLREIANRLEACFKLGNAMIITPQQMDQILMEGQKCRSKPSNIKQAKISGSRAGSRSKGHGLRGHTGAAQPHLLRLAQKTG